MPQSSSATTMPPVAAKTLTLEELFHLGRFRPASVQRQFQWTEKNADLLMADIQNVCFVEDEAASNELDDNNELDEFDVEEEMDVDDDIVSSDILDFADTSVRESLSNFFVGTIILDNEVTGNFAIYDGLQRLTTLTVLIATLRDLTTDAMLKERLDACIFDNAEPRLCHRGASSYLVDRIQKQGQAGLRRNMRSQPEGVEEQHIFAISRTIIDHIKRPREPVDQERVATLANFVLSGTLAVVLHISSREMARHVFIATNLYGQPLIRSQVAKGELLDLVDEPSEVAAVEHSWNTVRDRLAEQFDDFLRAFDIVLRARGFTQRDGRRRLLGPGPDPIGELVDHVRNRTAAGTFELTKWLNALDRFSLAWTDMRSQLKCPKEGDVDNYLWRLKFVPWKDWQPLALYWWEQYRAHRETNSKIEQTTIRRLSMLLQRCLLIELYNFSPEDRRHIFLNSVAFATRDRRVRGRLRKQDPFTTGGAMMGPPLNFSRKVRQAVQTNLQLPIENFATRRFVILFYETILHETQLPSGRTWNGSVEHILPVKPALDSHWLKVFKEIDERFFCLHSIGNLGLIDGDINKALGEKDFAIKRPAYSGQRAAFLSISDIEESIAEAAPHLRDGENRDDWTPTVIKRRTQRIAEKLWESLELRS